MIQLFDFYPGLAHNHLSLVLCGESTVNIIISSYLCFVGISWLQTWYYSVTSQLILTQFQHWWHDKNTTEVCRPMYHITITFHFMDLFPPIWQQHATLDITTNSSVVCKYEVGWYDVWWCQIGREKTMMKWEPQNYDSCIRVPWHANVRW